MEFRLVYEGPLESGNGKSLTQAKHEIRRALHPQLREVWKQFRWLRINIDYFAEQYQRFGFRFIPLINDQRQDVQYCKLDILFLRRDAPGNLVRHGGDLDNRIKVLFDGLRMADDKKELGGAIPGPDEDPFYCLLQDDKLITEVNITTDRLFTPPTGHVNDVVLVIRVRTPSFGIDDK